MFTTSSSTLQSVPRAGLPLGSVLFSKHDTGWRKVQLDSAKPTKMSFSTSTCNKPSLRLVGDVSTGWCLRSLRMKVRILRVRGPGQAPIDANDI